MKNAVIIGLLTFGAVLFFAFRRDSDNLSPLASPTPPPPDQTIEFGGRRFSFAWFEVKDPDRLFLYPNFTEKQTAEQIVKDKNCKSLVNAGFYSKADSPLGLFVADGETFGKQIDSSLFNGFLSKGDNGIKIGRLPPEKPEFAVQSGPLLIRDGSVQRLRIKNDDLARRVVAGLTDGGKLIFLVFYKDEAKFAGPNLVNLPGVVKAAADEIGVKLSDAINLDGGTASAFYSEEITLSELASVGSFFCLR